MYTVFGGCSFSFWGVIGWGVGAVFWILCPEPFHIKLLIKVFLPQFNTESFNLQAKMQSCTIRLQDMSIDNICRKNAWISSDFLWILFTWRVHECETNVCVVRHAQQHLKHLILSMMSFGHFGGKLRLNTVENKTFLVKTLVYFLNNS